VRRVGDRWPARGAVAVAGYCLRAGALERERQCGAVAVGVHRPGSVAEQLEDHRDPRGPQRRRSAQQHGELAQ
jgi:hypothetical protein